ncbi:hypothetical protein O6H91_Y339300 [Diphasiastrum complanatum]|nr:hypothetical protein O6H91_Y339300 [Diphasiastrum complanatum]
MASSRIKHNKQLLFYIFLCRVLMISWGLDQGSFTITGPPRGWNSYDAFSWIITEDEFLANAQIMADKLKSSGYEYVVVDFLWYRRIAPEASFTSPGFDLIDEWGRPVPDPARWPSTAGGKGFAPIATKVHAMGLKFGIHVMRGISTAAVSNNTPILGANGGPEGGPWTAQDIALTSRPCSWMPECFVSVNTSSKGGKAFINSLYQQYASWGVDFVKHDCVFGEDDLSLDEITTVSEAIVNTGRPMVYSLSPGVLATPSMGKLVDNLVDMYRATGDDWDTWNDLESHFDVARDFAAAGLIGVPRLQGSQSWPNLDMLPLGRLTNPGSKQGPHRSTRLTPDEQKTQITLWAMARSPLMYGGDLRDIDQATLSLITNTVILDINSKSFGNAEIVQGSSIEAVPVLSLISCEQATDTKWVIRNAESAGANDYLCWSVPEVINRAGELAHCLDWTVSSKPSISLNKKRRATEVGEHFSQTGFLHLWSASGGSMCLDSLHDPQRVAPNFDKITTKLFSSCSNQGSQIWKLTSEGQLESTSNSGVCVAIDAQVNTARIWAARGIEGQYYVAFFNLGLEASNMSTSLDKLIRSQNLAHGRGLSASTAAPSCTGKDVWSNQTMVGIPNGILSAIVPSHGCKLYSLTCVSN